MKKYLIPLAILAAAVAASAVLQRRERQASGGAETVRWTVMGTVAGISFRGADAAGRDAAREAAQDCYSRLENLLSAWKEDSELSRISREWFAGTSSFPAVPDERAAAGAAAAASPETRVCYETAFLLCRASGGAFSPVLGAAMRNTGFSRVSVLDLGGIAKGFAVDCAWERVAGGGAQMLLDLGGNLRVCGGGEWRTGIRNPFDGNSFAAEIVLTNGEAAATSGNYERFTVRDGIRISHILDGRTGKPCSGTAGVTVVHPSSAMLADGLSTALFVLGPAEGTRLLRGRFPGAEALWIPDAPDAPQIFATRGMAARLKNARFALTVVQEGS